MKLYEFTYTDEHDTSDVTTRKYIKEMLDEEAIMQGWATGWRVWEVGGTVKVMLDSLIANRRNFEVHGEYLTIEEMDK